jgi:hypothetical protein
MKMRKLSIKKTQRIVYEINPVLDSVLDEKKPKKATMIMPTPVNINT